MNEDASLRKILEQTGTAKEEIKKKRKGVRECRPRRRLTLISSGEGKRKRGNRMRKSAFHLERGKFREAKVPSLGRTRQSPFGGLG